VDAAAIIYRENTPSKTIGFENHTVHAHERYAGAR